MFVFAELASLASLMLKHSTYAKHIEKRYNFVYLDTLENLHLSRYILRNNCYLLSQKSKQKQFCRDTFWESPSLNGPKMTEITWTRLLNKAVCRCAKVKLIEAWAHAKNHHHHHSHCGGFCQKPSEKSKIVIFSPNQQIAVFSQISSLVNFRSQLRQLFKFSFYKRKFMLETTIFLWLISSLKNSIPPLQ